MHRRKANEARRVTAREIRREYFGRSYSRTRQTMCATHLTPTAKYVVDEARRLVERHRNDEFSIDPDHAELTEFVDQVEENQGEELSAHERHAAVAALSASLTNYDILTPLVENPKINDIIIRSFDDISVQTGRTNIQTDLKFPDHSSYVSFVENLLKRAGKASTLAAPVVDASIDSKVRACVTHESFSPENSGPMLTLRISRHEFVSLTRLVGFRLCPRIVLEYLAGIVNKGAASVLIAGEVGTGKTTLVRALALEIESDQAILVIEDTHEIVLDRPFTRTLLTRDANTEGAGRIAPAHAIRAGMRMAMNRVILGEMRDAEAAEAYIDVCSSGHVGMSTIHARSARDALSRLELFLSRAQSGVSISTIRRQISNAISVVVFLGIDPTSGERKILQVLEVHSSTDGEVQVSPIFSFVRPSDSSTEPVWRRESGISMFSKELEAQGFELPPLGTEMQIGTEPQGRAFERVRG